MQEHESSFFETLKFIVYSFCSDFGFDHLALLFMGIWLEFEFLLRMYSSQRVFQQIWRSWNEPIGSHCSSSTLRGKCVVVGRSQSTLASDDHGTRWAAGEQGTGGHALPYLHHSELWQSTGKHSLYTQPPNKLACASIATRDAVKGFLLGKGALCKHYIGRFYR